MRLKLRLPSWRSLLARWRLSAADGTTHDGHLYDRATTFEILSQTEADKGYPGSGTFLGLGDE